MTVLESLALNSATALLNCLQYSYLKSENAIDYMTAASLAATLCNILNQLEKEFPGVIEEYGWIASGTALPADIEPSPVLAKDVDRSGIFLTKQFDT